MLPGLQKWAEWHFTFWQVPLVVREKLSDWKMNAIFIPTHVLVSSLCQMWHGRNVVCALPLSRGSYRGQHKPWLGHWWVLQVALIFTSFVNSFIYCIKWLFQVIGSWIAHKKNVGFTFGFSFMPSITVLSFGIFWTECLHFSVMCKNQAMI